ncbi:MAG: tRNA lysidine(34) synthetase TilS, partial [Duncaniella sp.]|nr:tRNA lysidine(34) synthetase TilS [Duncaniella sp.]
PLGFKPSQASAIAALLSGEGGAARSGQHFTAGEHVWVLDHGILAQADNDSSLPEVSGDLASLPLKVERITREEFDSLRKEGVLGRDVICLDAECLREDASWTLRGWRAGDRLEPYGMKGSRLVSDIFSDAKTSTTGRRSVPLLLLGDKLLWVSGLRASRHYSVDQSTGEILKITLS